ncbi:MAG: chemotaxis protein CheA [Deltaproteobacteria bacterium]|jgi:two-component system chemotaxis sensor kinase CheA|nr:chemotaxis protein CheA [Deltaproteobacteria bacterium]
MTKTGSKVIPQLDQFVENLDSLSLNDREAWSGFAKQLAMVEAEIPKQMKPLLVLLEQCRRGIEAIAQKSLSDYLAIIDGIADGFAAAVHYLENGPDRKTTVQQAVDTLEGLLNGVGVMEETEHQPRNDSVTSDAPVTLDDLAAMLVQIDGDDRMEWQAVHEALERISAGDDHPEAVQTQLRDARTRLSEMLENGHPFTEAFAEGFGQSLQSAMDLLIDGTKFETAAMTPQTEPGSELHETMNAAAEPAVVSETPADESDATDSTIADEKPCDTEMTDAIDVSGEDAADCMPEDPDFELIGEFIEEGSDLIAQAEEALLKLETDPDDMDAVGMVFRAFHTIKGTSAFLELAIIADMGHHAESLLSRVRDREIRYTGGYADLSLRALDMLKALIESVQEALGGGPLIKPAGYNELLKILAAPEAAGISEDSNDVPAPRVGDLLVAQGKVTREDVESAVTSPRVGDILVAQGTATREQIEEAAREDGADPIGVKMVRTQQASTKDVGQALRAQQRIKNPQNVVDSSVRVSTSRLDRLIDMVGELVIAHSMVAQDDIVINGNNHDLIKKISHTTKIVRELQDMSMSLRMVPLKATFSKMTRLVRDVARKTGKQVHLITEGEETEIDRNLVDVINDPLVHMIRNAVDHGIESPEIRQEKGKNETGQVKLAAYHSAGNVVVEIQDDGKGLDRDVILTKAIQNGLISDGAALSDREIFNLVFEPGFSTATEVTDVSGRGVGMDVVRKNIESLRGQVEIHSVKGVGSTFKMGLPLTLAIIDGMVVRVGEETYVIPTVSIIKSIKPEPEDVSTVYGRGEMISVQGKLIPLVRLVDLYGLGGEDVDDDHMLVVIVEDEHHKAGLVIHELIGRQQVVIKTLGETMRHIPGISGSAIMPNGRVGLILDVGSLMRYASRDGHDGSKDKRQIELPPLQAVA